MDQRESQAWLARQLFHVNGLLVAKLAFLAFVTALVTKLAFPAFVVALVASSCGGQMCNALKTLLLDGRPLMGPRGGATTVGLLYGGANGARENPPASRRELLMRLVQGHCRFRTPFS